MELGDRMKYYERSSQVVLNSNEPILVRIDGKSFSKYVKASNFNRPFDTRFSRAMKRGVEGVIKESQQVIAAETHSDEASFLFGGFEREESNQYFGGKVQKLTSVLSSIFTWYFNQESTSHIPGFFDARAWNVPSEDEVANYFLWRSRDCFRNSVNDQARTEFSHKELTGKSTTDKLIMMSPKAVTGLEYHGRKYGSFLVPPEKDWFEFKEKPSFDMIKSSLFTETFDLKLSEIE